MKKCLLCVGAGTTPDLKWETSQARTLLAVMAKSMTTRSRLLEQGMSGGQLANVLESCPL